MTARHEICPIADLPPGERRIVDLDGVSIGVFNVDGEVHALKNECPHHRGPLCEGTLSGTTTYDEVGEYDWERAGRIIRCPWHGWEFDVTDGTSVFDPHAVRARTYEADVESREEAASGGDAARSDAEADGTADPGESSKSYVRGEDPPVDTYETDVEDGVVVVYV